MRVVDRAAAVIIFSLTRSVALRIDARAVGVARLAELVEDVFPLIAPLLAGGHEREVEHCAEACVLRILAVGVAVHEDAAIVREVVCAEERVLHRRVGGTRIGVVERGKHGPKRALVRFARAVDVGGEIEVGAEAALTHAPVVAEPAAQGTYRIVGHAKLLQLCVDARGKAAQAVVETEEIRAAAHGREKVAEVRAVVHRRADR